MNPATLKILEKLREIERENWNTDYRREIQSSAAEEGIFMGPSDRASEQEIDALREFAGTDLPLDYTEFLSFSNGLLNDLYGIKEIIEDRYRVRELMPGALPVGNNGGPNLYLLDLRSRNPETMRYVEISSMGLDWNEITGQWHCFHDLIEYMFSGRLNEESFNFE